MTRRAVPTVPKRFTLRYLNTYVDGDVFDAPSLKTAIVVARKL
jgi:hypothetical protein